jgi:hypothetical protein
MNVYEAGITLSAIFDFKVSKSKRGQVGIWRHFDSL